MGHELLTISSKVLLVVFPAVILFLLGLLFPKARNRNYKILATNDSIKFKQSYWRVVDLCELYKPIIAQSTTLRGPLPSEMFYEFIPPESGFFYIIYRVLWPDEVHPNIIIHWLYKIFRRFYYGSVRDIEIIQLKINQDTGTIEEIKFETDSSLDPEIGHSDHATVEMRKITGLRCIYHLSVNGESQGDIFLQKEDNRIKIPVLTWNHVFLAFHEHNIDYMEFRDLRLSLLSDEMFTRYRFDRRSWLDFGTPVQKGFPLKIGKYLSFSFSIVSVFVLFFIFP
ncbi:MAG: hypothetical protein ACTSW1_18260 [Candidatus Hodarchaeales archaeon]